jgi:3-hydroxyisobutyrate dehydrogenase-like beta-hydroxyacid dehydrogenase
VPSGRIGDMSRIPPRPVIGVLHPGAMGAAVGAALRPAAGSVIWAAAGRTRETSKRAELADLVGVPDVAALVRRADVIVSVCPPQAALEVAEEVGAALGTSARRPVYVDANAVAPGTVRRIGDVVGLDDAVDGAIIGPPAWERGRTVLWLSGPAAADVAALFARSPFDARVLGSDLGTASALKACFALQSKALPAIWLEIAEAARGYQVEDALRGELARFGVDYGAAVNAATGKESSAWRWAGEMDEAAATMAALGLPDGFSRAAGELYRRLADGRLNRTSEP